MEINIYPNVNNMGLIVAFFDSISSYFRSKRFIRTFYTAKTIFIKTPSLVKIHRELSNINSFN